jgi:hypothetical protein
MTEDFDYRDVWQKGDPKAAADAIAFWEENDALLAGVDPQKRAAQLCVMVYDGDTVVAVATTIIRRLPAVRADMAFYRAFVAPEYRSQKIVIALGVAVYSAMERFALANPQLRIGGTAAVVTAVPPNFKPRGTNMTMCGFTAEGDPIIIRWFDHYRL